MNKETLVMKLIEMLVGGGSDGPSKSIKSEHRLKGEYVIIRSRDSGCHFGILDSVEGRHVVLLNSRRMWRWWAAKEMTLSAVANFGLNTSRSELRIQSEVSSIDILDACEIIPCTTDCISSFSSVESYNGQ